IFTDPSNVKRLNAWVSDNMGFTWTIANSGGWPDRPHNINSVDTIQDGNILKITTKEANTGLVSYHTFNMATKLWEVIGIPVNGDGSDAATPNQHIVALCKGSDGNLNIAYSANLEMDGSPRDRCLLRYSTNDGQTWSSAILIGRHGITD